MKSKRVGRHTQLRRKLRTNTSPPEVVLWDYLRRKRMCDCKFRRQHSIGNYVVDFYCPILRLVIEIDGAQHNMTQDYDMRRDEYLSRNNYYVVRFAAHDVLFRIGRVVNQIEYMIIDMLNKDIL